MLDKVEVTGHGKPDTADQKTDERSRNLLKNLYTELDIIIDGKEKTQSDMKLLDPSTIQSIRVYKGETAVKLYGDKAKEGAIVITTKK